MDNRKGFTLIELLVVISIIALLMSIMIPTLSRVKKQSKDILCLANLRQWGVTAIAYANEHNDQMITYHDAAIWVYELRPFLVTSEGSQSSVGSGDISFCPRTKPRYDFDGEPSIGFGLGPLSAWGYYTGGVYLDGMAGSYAVNGWIYNPKFVGIDGSHILRKSWRTFNVKQGHKVPLIGGCYRYAVCPEAWDNPPEYEVAAEYVGLGSFCVNRHDGYTNIVFLDGSVRNVGLKELWTLWWHREWEQDWQNRTAGSPIDWPEWMKDFKDYN
jgi:prepilin-type N-terminal cleavage/methylation domain-containing protein/prepilin-type processing-associated H-X9-DG protein